MGFSKSLQKAVNSATAAKAARETPPPDDRPDPTTSIAAPPDLEGSSRMTRPRLTDFPEYGSGDAIGMPSSGLAMDALTQVRRNASQTIASSFQTQRVDQFGGQIYNRSNAQIASMSTPVGSSAVASGNRSTAYGAFAYAKEDSATALGVYAQASGPSSVAIGDQAKARGYRTIAIGRLTTATGASSISIGIGTDASGYQSIAIGVGAKASNDYSIAIGYGATSSGSSSMAIGVSASATHTTAIMIGGGATSAGARSVGIGFSVSATADSVVIGDLATSNGNSNVVVLGSGSSASSGNQFVAGSDGKPLTQVYFGEGPRSTGPNGYTIFGDEASGNSNTAGGDLNLCGGRGTGTANGGKVYLQTAPAGASGSVPNSAVNGASLDVNGILGLLSVKRVTTQVDKTASTAFTNLTALTFTLTAGFTYTFKADIYGNGSGTNGGYKFDLNGGTATATTINGFADAFDNSAVSTGVITALADVPINVSSLDYFHVVMTGTIKVNGGGTLIPRFAQNNANGTSSVYVGSSMQVTELL